MADDDRRAGRSAAWGVVAAVFAGGAISVWVTAGSPGSKFPSWPIFAFGAIAVAGFYLCFASLSGVRPIGRFLHRKGRPDSRDPLLAEIMESRLEVWRYIALVAALRVRITNTTGQPIRLSSLSFTHDIQDQAGWPGNTTADERLELERELHARRERQQYGIALRNYAIVPAHESVSGWVVEAVTRTPTGGTPACTVIVNDSVRNEYRVTLPRQEARVYGL